MKMSPRGYVQVRVPTSHGPRRSPEDRSPEDRSPEDLSPSLWTFGSSPSRV